MRRRLFTLLFASALALGGPALVRAAGGGAAIQLFEDGNGNWICIWQCNSGSTGQGTVTRPYGKSCLNLCAGACNGPCIPLY